MKAIHNELPVAAHGEGRNANCPRATFVAGARQPGYWIPVTLGCFSQRVWREIQYVPQLRPVNESGILRKSREGRRKEQPAAAIRIIDIMELLLLSSRER
jgi:hypothetical protein